MPRAGGAGGGKRAGGGACAAADHGGDAATQSFFNLLWANEMDVGIQTAGCDDVALAADDFSARADDDVDAGLRVGVAGFADRHNAAILEANVCFDDAPVVNDQGIGEHGVDGTFCSRALRLCHSVANGFAAAEFHFFAITTCLQSEVFLDFNNQISICQANSVAHGGAEDFGVGLSLNRRHVRASLALAS